MENHEEHIKRLEAALKTAKLKIWVTSLVGILIASSLSITTFFVGKQFGERINIPVLPPPPDTLKIALNTPPTGFGNRIPSNQNGLVEQGFTDYKNMLSANGIVTIPNGTPTPDLFPFDTIMYSRYELISIEALAQMLKEGQNTTQVPAYILIRDGKMGTAAAPRIKKYLMMVDNTNSLIRDNSGNVIYYNELRRCPNHCPIPEF